MPSGSGSRLKSCSGKSVTKARSWISVEDDLYTKNGDNTLYKRVEASAVSIPCKIHGS